MKYESDLQKAILDDVESLEKQSFVFKIMKANKDGIPDVYFTTKQTGAIHIEVKREKGGRPSTAQEANVEQINNNGSRAFFCCSWSEWREIKKKIGLITRSANK